MCNLQLFVLVIAVFTGSSSAKPLHFGWYGNDPTNQHGWTNLGFSDDLAVLQQANSFGINQLYQVDGIFFESGTRDGLPALVLRVDWLTSWQSYLPLFNSLLSNGTIIGFFIGDELVWNGLQFSDLILASNQIRTDYPHSFIWENEAVPVFQCLPTQTPNCTDGPWPACCDYAKRPIIKNGVAIPPALSAVSIDMYSWNPNWNLIAEVQAYYKQYLYPGLLANQSVFLVPGSAASTHNPICNVSCYDELCARDAQAFYEWAQADPLVAGMMPWTWFDCTGCVPDLDEIGTIHMNVTKSTWIGIGKNIIQSMG
eukprot:TRINITY_DN1703_c0_g1_i1.p1 TRINITY_DN1703_c0_g1~~TRINITY_DN1703_c0_g1_i1.p1  ORF type:complete len:312 (-),score=16.40 TRINITY_DN1703_c0_g1_i1:33-968(-)